MWQPAQIIAYRNSARNKSANTDEKNKYLSRIKKKKKENSIYVNIRWQMWGNIFNSKSHHAENAKS